MNKRTQTILAASLAVIAVVMALYYALPSRSPRLDLDPYEVLGAVAAEETAKLVGDKGRVLVVVRDTGADKNPSVEAELKAFQQTLQKHPGLTLVTERFLATPMLMMATGGGVPPEQLLQALQTHANVQALVLFCGIAPLANAELAALRQRAVKMVVVSAFHSEYRRLFEQQVLHLAIVPRPEAPPPDAPPPRTLRDRFDQNFAIVTPATVARW